MKPTSEDVSNRAQYGQRGKTPNVFHLFTLRRFILFISFLFTLYVSGEMKCAARRTATGTSGWVQAGLPFETAEAHAQ
jgi:hypothetical protein